jgi:hypothetical protein
MQFISVEEFAKLGKEAQIKYKQWLDSYTSQIRAITRQNAQNKLTYGIVREKHLNNVKNTYGNGN